MPHTTAPGHQTFAERLQFRVGHGGFHATIVRESPGGPPLLTYVYDVGAVPDIALLRTKVDDFVAHLTQTGGSKVDYVILSHIDEDHVNGLDHLLSALSNIAVGTIVLPWLSAFQKLQVQLSNNYRTPSAVATNLAKSDTAADEYLRGLGAEDIVRVGQPASSAPPADERPPARSEETSPSPAPASPGSAPHSGTLPAPPLAYWCLIPFRAEPPHTAATCFETELRKSLAGVSPPLDPSNPDHHAEILRAHRREVRDALKQAAAQVPGVRPKDITNWSSLVLLAGSTAPSAGTPHPCSSLGDFTAGCDTFWLHTGDIPANRITLWNELNAWLTSHLKGRSVCTVVAPHHGSKLSHNPALYGSVSPSNIVITTGRNQGGRVSKGINAALVTALASSLNIPLADLHN